MSDPNQCSIYLKRLQFFLDLIGNPEKSAQGGQVPHYIHVAGTSGKGSVCLMLDSILRQNGFKTGTMTSPDTGILQTRWQINGKMMTKNEFAKILTELKPKLEKYLTISPYDPISHFELMTAIGLYWFAKRKVDWCVLEAGCGGRYDSTNIIPRKDIAVITNIGLDHTDILGKTKEKIAHEKAGIIKRNCAVFTGEQNKKVLNIIQNECRKQRVSLKIFNLKFLILKQFLNKLIFKYQNCEYLIQALGQHQIKNAILAIEIAKALKIPETKIKTGLAKVKLPLRMEIISRKPLVILDGAHNPDKMRTTVETIKKIENWKLKIENLHLIVGFSADKNINQMIKQLSSLKPQTIACTRYTLNPFRQPADPKLIAKTFKELKLKTKIKIFNNPKQAFNWSKKQQKTGDILLVTGSMYLSGEIKKLTFLSK